jgi:hypothetical protein
MGKSIDHVHQPMDYVPGPVHGSSVDRSGGGCRSLAGDDARLKSFRCLGGKWQGDRGESSSGGNSASGWSARKSRWSWQRCPLRSRRSSGKEHEKPPHILVLIPLWVSLSVHHQPICTHIYIKFIFALSGYDPNNIQLLLDKMSQDITDMRNHLLTAYSPNDWHYIRQLS